MKKLESLVSLIERLALVHKEIIMIISTIALCAVVISPLLGG